MKTITKDKAKQKPGYKYTKLGWIPNDWEIQNLQDISYIDKKSLSSNFCPEKTIKYVSLADINNGQVAYSQYLFKDAPSRARRITKKGDILLSTVRPNLKNFAIIEENGLIASTGFAVLSEKHVHNEFLIQFLYSQNADRQYHNLTVGSNYPALNSSDIKKFKIVTPLKREQKSIAQCLSIWDSTITKLNALIKAKQTLKKGLMQQLLTGKKRLPGFYGEWEKLRLDDVTNFFSRRNKELIEARVYSVTNYDGFVYQSDHFSRELVGDDLASYKIIKKNEFAYNPARINVGSIAFFEDEIGIISSLYVCFSTNEKMTDDYMRYFIQLEKTQFDFNRYGEGGVRIYLWYPLFASIKVEVPPITEQKAISNVLLAADKEIQLLQEQLEQMELQKKGMMQQLLTGKKRLINN